MFNNIDILNLTSLAVVAVFFALLALLRRKNVLGFTPAVLIAMVIGLAIGFVFSGHTDYLRPFGGIYISLLTAFVAPLIIVCILSSITSLGSAKQLKGIGARSVFWLLSTTLIAIIITFIFSFLLKVGKGANITIDGLDASMYENRVVNFLDVIVDFFPNNFVSDIASDKIIPIILFSTLLAVSYVLVAQNSSEKVVAFKKFVEAFKEILFTAVGFIIELTPFAIIPLVAESIGASVSRSDVIISLGVLLLITFLVLAVDIWLVNGVLIKIFARVSPFRFFKKAVDAQAVAFSTQSSVGTLPVTIKVLTRKLGVSLEIANFTAPLGTTIGMPGCAAIWPLLNAIYGINALGIEYSIEQYAVLGLLAFFVAMGTAGVPGTATVTTASVLTAAGLPLEILVLVLPISAIADTLRTASNVTAALTASIIVARQENDLNENIFYDKEVFNDEQASLNSTQL
jgi:Na+/H+-dicarboxylate symporter